MMAPQVRSEDRQKTIHLPLQSQKKKKKKITWAKLKTQFKGLIGNGH
jgi:hypothetical protein